MDVRGFLNAISAPKEAPGDYFDAEGFLCCGKCRTRKQADIPCSRAIRESGVWRVPVPCRCEEAAQLGRAQREREQAAARLQKRLFLKSGLDAAAVFSNYDAAKSPASVISRKYCQKLDEAAASGLGVLFYGGVGTGKSFFAQCIGNAAISAGKSVFFVNVSALLLADADARQDALRRAEKDDFLILDDVGAQRRTSFGDEVLYHIVNTRCRTSKPLIATTNLSLTQMKEEQELAACRVFDRLLEMCPVRVKMDGESRRRTAALQKREEAKRLILGETG